MSGRNLLGLAVVAALFACGVFLGFRTLGLHELWRDGAPTPIAALRMLRMAAALTVGGALALSGMVFQAVLRNPLAEPFTLGLSGGAGVGAALAFVLGWRAYTIHAVPLAALAGALAILLLVLWISRGGGRGGETLLLSGVIAGTVASSVLIYILSVAQNDELCSVTWWMLGDLQGVDVGLGVPAALYTLAALLVLRCRAGALNALALGAENAWYLGVAPRKYTVFFVLVAALLAAMTVALAGLIGFVGLIVPHVVRKLYGCDHRQIVVTVFLWGAAFLMFCDTVSRLIFVEREIPIGVITALVGGGVFLALIHTGDRTRGNGSC